LRGRKERAGYQKGDVSRKIGVVFSEKAQNQGTRGVQRSVSIISCQDVRFKFKQKKCNSWLNSEEETEKKDEGKREVVLSLNRSNVHTFQNHEKGRENCEKKKILVKAE